VNNCDNCLFYELAMCHRYPPVFIEYLALDDAGGAYVRNGKTYRKELFEEVDDYLNWSHPAVDDEDWCGEWRKKRG